MIKIGVPLRHIQEPFSFSYGGPLLSDADLVRLGNELPPRDLYSHEVKVGVEHKKNYNMWRRAIFEQGKKTAAADRLPAAWQELLDALLRDDWRRWLSLETNIDVTTLPVTIGLYIFENGNFTSIDNGKLEKALSVALYLNHEWAVEYGGNLHLWNSNQDRYELPARTFVARGGHVAVCRFSETSWHSIGAVRNGSSRVSMMIEYWQKEPEPRVGGS